MTEGTAAIIGLFAQAHTAAGLKFCNLASMQYSIKSGGTLLVSVHQRGYLAKYGVHSMPMQRSTK
ncbi:MAG: hypothetical protein K2X29_13240 [Candidatus Obscuribacterales bacterium]|nr:hypothetical protein [Candidatus Obscuribacterales bacterium]